MSSDETIRRHVMNTTGPGDPTMATRRLVELGWAESLELLGGVSLGRLVFSDNALPAIRPVNHLLDHGDIVIRSHFGATITTMLRQDNGVVVTYEADVLDPQSHLGWSVIMTGLARLVADAGEVAHYEQVLHPWISGPTMDNVIRIHPTIISGCRLVADD